MFSAQREQVIIQDQRYQRLAYDEDEHPESAANSRC